MKIFRVTYVTSQAGLQCGEMPFGPLTVYIYGIWKNTRKIGLTFILGQDDGSKDAADSLHLWNLEKHLKDRINLYDRMRRWIRNPVDFTLCHKWCLLGRHVAGAKMWPWRPNNASMLPSHTNTNIQTQTQLMHQWCQVIQTQIKVLDMAKKKMISTLQRQVILNAKPQKCSKLKAR